MSKASLGTSKVTISDGYTLKLGKDVDKSSMSGTEWTLKNTTATLNQTASAGYYCDGSTITYSKKSFESSATIKGVKSTTGLSAKDNVITLKNAALSSKVTVSGDYTFDFVKDYNSATISGSAGADIITTRGKNISISAGDGKDLIKVLGSATTVNGGKGDDTIESNGKGNVFVYKAGDGNDLITNYASEDSISITSGTVSKITTSGNNVIFTVGDGKTTGKITIKGGKDKIISYSDSDGEQTYPAVVKIESSTITLLDHYFKDDFKVSDYGSKLQTIDASKVPHDLNITGNKLANKITGSSQDDYIDGGEGADGIYGGDGNDSLIGGKGNDTLEGGKGSDKLTGGAGDDVFVYKKGDGNDVITDYAENDRISIVSGSVSNIATKSKAIVFTVGTGKLAGNISISGGKGKVISYSDEDGEHLYPVPVKIKSKTITLLEAYMEDSFNIADHGDTLQTIDASAVSHDLSIMGNKLANKITGSSQDDSINGGNGADTIFGGTGNDTLTGGNGADVFVYKAGDGKDVITDYAEVDTIKIDNGTVSNIKKNGDDVVFTVGKGSIIVKNARDKVISYSDKNGEQTYPQIVKVDGAKIKLTKDYNSDSFKLADYGNYKTIDASAVAHDLKITGDGKANMILGGEENDTILGGKGNDSLQGNSGADVFVYANGDGNDVIIDYKEEDRIKITKGTVKKTTVKDKDVVFAIGSGKITVQNGAGKEITYINDKGKTVKKTYKAEVAWFLEDDNNFSTDNELSALVEEKTYLPDVQLDTSNNPFKETQLITYSGRS